jgi:hypothetical protein
MAMVSPIGMLIFRNIFNQSEKAAEEQAELAADEATGEVERPAASADSKEG